MLTSICHKHCFPPSPELVFGRSDLVDDFQISNSNFFLNLKFCAPQPASLLKSNIQDLRAAVAFPFPMSGNVKLKAVEESVVNLRLAWETKQNEYTAAQTEVKVTDFRHANFVWSYSIMLNLLFCLCCIFTQLTQNFQVQLDEMKKLVLDLAKKRPVSSVSSALDADTVTPPVQIRRRITKKQQAGLSKSL